MKNLKKIFLLFILLISTPVVAAFNTVEDLYESIVKIEVKSSNIFGEVRSFSGTIIDSSGLIVTAGIYAHTANTIVVTFNNGKESPAKSIGYDETTGLSLLKTEETYTTKGLRLYGGDLGLGMELGVLPFKTLAPSKVRVAKQLTYVASWEYQIKSAIFTEPVSIEYLGVPLITPTGELAGIGRLLTADIDVHPERRVPGNIFIPIKSLTDNLGRLLKGNITKPWYGFSLIENKDKSLRVLEVDEGSPAKGAGLLVGDNIMAIDSKRVLSLSQFYEKIWKAKVEPINLMILRNNVYKNIVLVGELNGSQ